jgi:hypothetical protein
MRIIVGGIFDVKTAVGLEFKSDYRGLRMSWFSKKPRVVFEAVIVKSQRQKPLIEAN